MDNIQQMPVIVLMDNDSTGGQSEIREWFEHSRFATCEASNIFEALEQLSDFTLRTRPDVVLLGVDSCEDDLPMVSNVAGLPTMAISGKKHPFSKGKGQYFHANLGQVATHLDKLIPQ